jgi:hypothetical protein
MTDRYRLGDVENSELLTTTLRLVERGNEITAEVLAHLAEIEDRMLHLELGFTSLFAYCVESLGMSEGAAGRRVAAARVCRRFSEVFALVASGELHLSAVCAVASHLDSSNASELLGACRRKTRRQVDELLAERFPKANVREGIRRLPSQEIEPLGGERFGVHFTADGELCELMARARAVASHRLPGGDLVELMKMVFAKFVKREEARRFAVGRKPRPTKPTIPVTTIPVTTIPDRADQRNEGARETENLTPPGGVPRWVPAAVRRAVYARDDGRCSFVAADGRRCAARARLELDHVEPWALGGSAKRDNLRLRCRAHNALHARHCFGAKRVAAKIAARRAGVVHGKSRMAAMNGDGVGSKIAG